MPGAAGRRRDDGVAAARRAAGSGLAGAGRARPGGQARGRQTRTLRAGECDPLARATALLIALRLDPTGVGRIADDLPAIREPAAPDGPAPSPASPDVPPFAPPDSPAPAVPPFSEPTIAAPVPSSRARSEPAPSILDVVEMPAPAPASSRPVQPPPKRPGLAGHLRLEGGFDYGVLPGIGGNVGGAGGLAIRGVRLELGVLAVPSRIARPAAVDAAGRFDRLAAAIRVCPGWRVPRGVTLFGCVGVEAGAIRAEGTDGVARPRVLWAPWSAVLFGAAVRWGVVGPLGLWLGAEGVAALTRPGFTVGPDDRALFRAQPLAIRINVGVDLQFPARRR
jgi:hypothetical protein